MYCGDLYPKSLEGGLFVSYVGGGSTTPAWEWIAKTMRLYSWANIANKINFINFNYQHNITFQRYIVIILNSTN